MLLRAKIEVRPAIATAERYDMLVSEHARKTVVFIGILKDGEFKPHATGFLMSYRVEGGGFLYIVTAEHVISGLLTRGHEIIMRANMENGEGGDMAIPASHWKFHPDETTKTDVAVAAIGDKAIRNSDGKVFRMDFRQVVANDPTNSAVATEDIIAAHGIGPGEEVSIIGLFRKHFGTELNIPIVRTGNIATMKGEPVFTKYAGWIDAHLVEMRSIAGLSGSPVFVNMAPYRVVDNKVRNMHGSKQLYLFGLVHGHFDVKNLHDDSIVEDGTEVGGINTGIGVVIPVEKLIETLEHPDLVAQREEVLMRRKKESGAAIPDLALPEEPTPSATSENPEHKEAFKSLLGAAAKKQKPDG